MQFNRTRRVPASVEVGATYYRMRGGNVSEFAEVVALRDDGLGIPHVRFRLKVARGGGVTEDGPRTLSLDSFRQLYPVAS